MHAKESPASVHSIWSVLQLAGGVGQQSMGWAHWMIAHSLLVGAIMNWLVTHTPTRPLLLGRQARPDAQSLETWHASPFCERGGSLDLLHAMTAPSPRRAMITRPMRIR
jgi:hypothetical protein